ncbi:MAG: tetratricopeptide repeat protein [Balneolaceae bacterium]
MTVSCHKHSCQEEIQLCLISLGSDPLVGYNREVAQWLYHFGSVRILSDRPRPIHLPGDVLWTEVLPDTPRAGLWNRAVEENKYPWTLLLERGEQLDLDDLHLTGRLEEGRWPVAYIRWKREEEIDRVYHQPRLIPGGWVAPFDGLDIPDASRSMLKRSILFGSGFVRINRGAHPFDALRGEPPRPGEVDTPTWKLTMGEFALDRKNPLIAASQFRTLLARSDLLPSDRLTALNGLASSYAEQNRWEEALELTNRATNGSPYQWLSYLIRYRILDLSGDKGAARQALSQYEEVMQKSSQASMDRRMSRVELIRRQVHLDIGMGDLTRALEGLDRLVDRVQGVERHNVVLRAIRIALQARDRDRAAQYLIRIKNELAREQASPDHLQELEILMDGMAEEGWFELLLPVYEWLQERDPANETYRRRLIVALSRTGFLSRARRMMREA